MLDAQVTFERWVRLVQSETGLGPFGWRSRKLEGPVRGVLARHVLPERASRESAAVVAARLIEELFELRPLRRWVRDLNATVAAATGIELLRQAGWQFSASPVAELASILDASDPVLRLASCLLDSGEAAGANVAGAAVYVSVPVSGQPPATKRVLEGLRPTMEDALERAGAEIGTDLFLWAPGIMARGFDGMRERVRLGIQRGVLHFAVGLNGGTVGMGIEIQASIARRRPVVWLVPPGDTSPNSIAMAGVEADVQIVELASLDDIGAAVYDGVIANASAVAALIRENRSIPVDTVQLQQAWRRQWMRLSSMRPLLDARIKPARAEALLLDPFIVQHEASRSEVAALSTALGIEDNLDLEATRHEKLRTKGRWQSSPAD